MKPGLLLPFFLLVAACMSGAQPGEPSADPARPRTQSALRGRILELLQQDVRKLPPPTPQAIAPHAEGNSANDDQPVAEGLLELDPITITQKRVIELPRIPKLTLENFFYGDGTIAQSAGKRVSLSAGPERRGLAAIKLNFKF